MFDLRATLVCLALVSALGAVPGAAALAEGRVALLIGNANYASAELDLRNPANDAAALEKALDGLGFETRALIDADQAETDAALADFAREAEGADVALFFFAGHGVQIEGANYLLGSGFSTLSRAGIIGEALSLDDVRAALIRARPGLGLIVLDACRNNPFSQSGLAARGLARAQGGSGLLIAYATDPGNFAYDGMGKNSAFTAALIGHIATPGLEVRLMFGRVRQDVVLASGGLQVPWVEEAVIGEHFLNAAPVEGAPGDAPEMAVAKEVRLWREAVTEGSVQAYRRYMESYPEGLFQSIAAERLDAPPEPAAEPVSVPAGSNRDNLMAALTTLGFLAEARGVSQDQIDIAYQNYARQFHPGPGLDGLYLDAAQFAVMVGAATAQDIQTELGALAAIETAIGSAERARDELRGLATSNARAQASLRAADENIAASYADRERVLDRLDESRSSYAELVDRASRHFRPYLARALPGLTEGTRGPAASHGRLAEHAQQFVKHATADGVARAQGSYAWMADFLPQD